LDDFINRASPKDINKLQLEGLVKAGAFDELEINRSSLLNSIPRLIQMNKSIFDEKDSNQNNLFSENSNEKNTIFNLEKTQQWSNNELLMNEFHSIGFYMSDHPLKIYKDYFDKSKVVSFKDFVNGSENNALVAGTIMSIQEKKSAKGTSFAIVKFSDLKSEFELFLFSDLLITNRDQLKMANSFILTLQKDNSSNSAITRRINIRNINSLSNFTDKAFERVTIEINGKSDLNELQNILKENGITKIQIKVCKKSKIYTFSLKNTRKFGLSTFNHIKNKEYVKKISF
jgi:DNA polymerase-3 subunit alpha